MRPLTKLIIPRRRSLKPIRWRVAADLPPHCRLAFAALAVALSLTSGLSLAQAQPAQSSQPEAASQPAENGPAGPASDGKALFLGNTPFQNGGPPCAVCHSISGLPFPNGGTLGPNLSHAYERMGANGVKIAIQTLYFPVMAAVYDTHPLTGQEQADLEAFVKDASTQPPASENTGVVAGISFAGFLILLVVTHFLWKDRLKSVRRSMVEKAMRQRR